jgi:protein SCO1/2
MSSATDWVRALLAGGAAGALAFTLGLGWWRVDGPGAARASADPVLPLPLGEMDWTLVDQTGAAVRPSDWVGRPTLAFLGFTYCPDVCPLTLMDISGWLEELGPDADRLNVALISVDPARDTPEALADYLGNFDPRIDGLTGDPAEVAGALRDLRAKAEKVPVEGGGYTMNHTAGVFLFGADGRFASIIDLHEDRAFAVPKLRRLLG